MEVGRSSIGKIEIRMPDEIEHRTVLKNENFLGFNSCLTVAARTFRHLEPSPPLPFQISPFVLPFKMSDHPQKPRLQTTKFSHCLFFFLLPLSGLLSDPFSPLFSRSF